MHLASLPAIGFLTIDISLSAAMQAGRDRDQFARQGQAITTADALIAAVAREQRATILTSNIKDYPMPGVSVLSPGQEQR